jgi:hypothetical protein
MKTITKHWDGRELRETVKVMKDKDMLFRIVTGLCNGHSEDCVYMWTDQGWKFVIGKHDIDIPTSIKDISYVHSEPQRKLYAEKLNELLKIFIIKLF